MVEDDVPGGHAPGYFAMLNNPPPVAAFNWRNDPAAFQGFPEFFLAHELAHQWFGQAVGWKNYHEQWLERRLRAILRRALCAKSSAAKTRSATCCGSSAAGRSRIPIRARSISAIASATSRARAASSARWSTTRAPRCCTCCGA